MPLKFELLIVTFDRRVYIIKSPKDCVVKFELLINTWDSITAEIKLTWLYIVLFYILSLDLCRKIELYCLMSDLTWSIIEKSFKFGNFDFILVIIYAYIDSVELSSFSLNFEPKITESMLELPIILSVG